MQCLINSIKKLTKIKRSTFLLFFSTILSLIITPQASFADTPEFTIENFYVVSVIRLGHKHYQYEFKADVTNTSTVDAANVSVTVASSARKVTVVDDSLTFGDIAAGETVTSADTFILQLKHRFPFRLYKKFRFLCKKHKKHKNRKKCRFPFNKAHLEWTFNYDSTTGMVTVPDLSGMYLQEAQDTLEEVNLVLGDVDERPVISMPTGIVVGQSIEPFKEAEEGVVIDLLVPEPPPIGVVIPSEWSGIWEITTTYRDSETSDILGKEKIKDVICKSDNIGLSLAELVADSREETNLFDCSGAASENRMETTCSANLILDYPTGSCDVISDLEFNIQRNENEMFGRGTFTAQDSGCSIDEHQIIEISGKRLNVETGGLCERPDSSFLQKFLSNPFLSQDGLL